MTKAIKDKIDFKKYFCKSKKIYWITNLAFDISEMISMRKDLNTMIISQRNVITPTVVQKPICL